MSLSPFQCYHYPVCSTHNGLCVCDQIIAHLLVKYLCKTCELLTIALEVYDITSDVARFDELYSKCYSSIPYATVLVFGGDLCFSRDFFNVLQYIYTCA